MLCNVGQNNPRKPKAVLFDADQLYVSPPSHAHMLLLNVNWISHCDHVRSPLRTCGCSRATCHHKEPGRGHNDKNVAVAVCYQVSYIFALITNTRVTAYSRRASSSATQCDCK